ncbi:putative dehydrogenase [Spinactinospora alkalitolerans]|uniref:Putative dehydrogenase n=1 Tax=Spinactinospora alkalitolerans TaxID=687207 RepID=A0A852U490_9ACTN|nr:Gfo/Idh/MocA family oxidoreductase [Spinactinospora alkalitolerans]NYE50302.1 putative dehydrogenase [Spinactinospora alkalitolerans]
MSGGARGVGGGDGVNGPDRPVRVGLVGAGPWASTMHAPVLAAGPETRLTAVWARRPDAAAALADRFGAVAAGSVRELFDTCEAVAFAVPPAVQAELAPLAAEAGRAVLLEKPLAPTLDGARAVADAVARAGVVSQFVLTKRYHPETRRFLARAQRMAVTGARSCYLHGAFLGGDLATQWRLEHGALLDLGPHLLDLLDASVGRIAAVRATGDPRTWIELACEHENGAVSQASLSGSVRLSKARTRVELYGPDEELVYDTGGIDHDECWPVLRREFAAAVRSGTPPELDAQRGLRLQELLDMAARDAGRDTGN